MQRIKIDQPFTRELIGDAPVTERRFDIQNVSRRDFLKNTGLASGGMFVLGVFGGLRVDALNEDGMISPSASAGSPIEDGAFQPNVFIALNEDGEVFIVSSRVEMGQGVKSSVPPLIADEMEADFDRVQIIQGDGDAKYGNQSTGGSTSIRALFDHWRKAGATARIMLVAAAAERWGVAVSECEAENHVVYHRPTGRQAGYGELAMAASAQPVPANPPFKPREKWRYAGSPIRGIENRDFATGKAEFGLDVALPGMLYASVEHCPTIGGSLVSYDDSATLSVQGVRQVVEIPVAPASAGYQPLGGLAVLADNTWAAFEGREALEVKWALGPNAGYNSDSYKTELKASAESPGTEIRNVGDFDSGFASAVSTLEATYYMPMQAHIPMEVPNATAWVREDGTCECWAPTQAPQAARSLVASLLGLDEVNVTVHIPLVGGAFGRKGKPDYVGEAALISKAVGAPVKLTWKREDSMRFDYYHAPSAQHLKAGFDERGIATAWLHRTSFPSISSTFGPGVTYAGEGELNQGFKTVPYDIANMRLESGPAAAHVRIGWMRSVANIHHGWAVNAFAGEMAHAQSRDQLDYFLELIGPDRSLNHLFPENPPYGENLEAAPYHTSRLKGVLRRAADEAGWGSIELGSGEGMGVAVHYCFGSYVAWVIRVAVEDDDVRVIRADGAIDCGTIINPDRVRAQMEGNLVFGLALALYGGVTARDGAIEQGNFNDHRLLRLRETPETHVYLTESTMIPGGVGEPGLPPVAPALTNAILATTGRPVRELPVRI
jgi:isoquinoline 1-oxidoreductase beta subunit